MSTSISDMIVRFVQVGALVFMHDCACVCAVCVYACNMCVVCYNICICIWSTTFPVELVIVYSSVYMRAFMVCV